jgi:hypothetical protein
MKKTRIDYHITYDEGDKKRYTVIFSAARSKQEALRRFCENKNLDHDKVEIVSVKAFTKEVLI